MRLSSRGPYEPSNTNDEAQARNMLSPGLFCRGDTQTIRFHILQCMGSRFWSRFGTSPSIATSTPSICQAAETRVHIAAQGRQMGRAAGVCDEVDGRGSFRVGTDDVRANRRAAILRLTSVGLADMVIP